MDYRHSTLLCPCLNKLANPLHASHDLKGSADAVKLWCYPVMMTVFMARRKNTLQFLLAVDNLSLVCGVAGTGNTIYTCNTHWQYIDNLVVWLASQLVDWTTHICRSAHLQGSCPVTTSWFVLLQGIRLEYALVTVVLCVPGPIFSC